MMGNASLIRVEERGGSQDTITKISCEVVAILFFYILDLNFILSKFLSVTDVGYVISGRHIKLGAKVL